jgi:c-di-GMP-binding flagellar brake protein YcgR
MPTETAEEHPGYTLHGRGDIIEKFRLMQKKRCLMTAHREDSRVNLITAVVEVLPEKGLVAFDVSANEALNRRFAAAGPVVFIGQVDGVKSRFAVDGLNAATLRGQSVLAASLPESLYWQQQRKYYRVAPPMNMPVKCKVALAGVWHEFEVYDLSISGLALCDRRQRLGEAIEIGYLLEQCVLEVPGHGELRLVLEVRDKVPLVRALPPGGQRVGCAFHSLGRSAEVHLQKFVFEVELQKRRQSSLLRG